MGTYRAVKIVSRRSFPDDRPYEREFNGIKRFEPISRSHDSQVDILHVGRNDADGYFYYVMELADDASAECGVRNAELDSKAEDAGAEGSDGVVESWSNAGSSVAQAPHSSTLQHSSAPALRDPSPYVPRTLKLELQRRGRLLVEECIQIGLSLTTALEHLHANGLVHRDVKPSNIIFVNGVPKLADVGLVTDLDATVSFVGTEGYLPPEGPGTPQADLYSLGKVLYELCTGKDRQDFPDPPTRWESSPDEEALREFHEILLRACERDARKRYQTAREMRADLALLQSGKSVRRLHVLERRVAVLTRAGLIGASLLVVVMAGYLFAVFEKREAVKESQRADREARRAQLAERDAKEKLWGSYLAQARANRWSGRAGRRFESLEALARAAAIRPSPELRDEAIACLALADFRLGPGNEPHFKDGESLCFDPKFERYARSDTNFNVSVCRAEDGAQVGYLPAPRGPDTYIWLLKLSPGGRFLATQHHPTGRDVPNLFRIWDVDRGKMVLEWPKGIYYSAMDFSEDGRWAALAQYKGPVVVYDLAAGEETNRFDRGAEPFSMRLSPDARALAISGYNSPVVELRDTLTGALAATLPHPGTVWRMSWHPGGKILAAACADGNLYVWDTATTQRLAVLKGHTSPAIGVTFNHGGDLLASSGWDSRIRLWDPWQERELASLPLSATLQFSPDDRWLGSSATSAIKTVGFEVAAGRERRTLRGHAAGRVRSGSFSPDGRLLATLGTDGVRLWKFPASRQVAFLLMRGGNSVVFTPDGGNLIACGEAGLWRWPIAADDSEQAVGVRVGEPQEIRLPWKAVTGAALSPDGEFLAAVCAGCGAGCIIALNHPEQPFLRLEHFGAVGVAFSPDGQWVATATVGGTGVRVWEARTGRLAEKIPIAGQANVAFSPKGHWLATGTPEEFRFWEVGTWKKRHGVEPESRVQSPSGMAFSPDETMLAIPRLAGGVKLVEPATGKVIATLDGTAQQPLCFTPDGATLAVAEQLPDQQGSLVRLWDLRLVRQELAAMKLDWDAPPLPAGSTNRRVVVGAAVRGF
jgi:WD40 repeat protein